MGKDRGYIDIGNPLLRMFRMFSLLIQLIMLITLASFLYVRTIIPVPWRELAVFLQRS